MPRPLLFVFGTILSFFLLMWMFWLVLPPETPAEINLKGDQGSVSGKIIKKDKYVIVNNGDGRNADIYNWDQIESIREGPPSLTVMGRAVEWVEFISKLGACLAIGLFLLAIYQYTHGQKWEREKFLAGIVKEFRAAPKAQAAASMVDSLHNLSQGRRVMLYPDAVTDRQERFVTNSMVKKALRTDRNDFSQDEIAVRECFDAFFNYLESLDHYIGTGLVKKRSVYRYANYWIDLLGKDEHPGPAGGAGRPAPCEVCGVLLRYAHAYDFYGVQNLLDRYTKRYRLTRWLACRRPSGEGAGAMLLKFLTGRQNWTRTRRAMWQLRPPGSTG